MMSKYHKGRKKGACSHFYHKKSSKAVDKTSNLVCLNSTSLPPNWHLVDTGVRQQYCKLSNNCNHSLQVAVSIIVMPDGKWKAYAGSKLIPNSSKMLREIPENISSSNELISVITTLDRATPCPGNMEQESVSIYQAKGGVVKGGRGNGAAVAFVEDHSLMTSSGTTPDHQKSGLRSHL